MPDTLYTVGIDVGSSTVKVAVVSSPAHSGRERQGAKLLGKVVERTRRRDQRQIVELCLAQAREQAGVAASDIAYVATTGEGEAYEEATGHFYGMTAHARGALFLDPTARAALEKELAATRTRGFALEEEETVVGVACVAVPLAVLGEPLAAVSVSVPVHRFPARQRTALIAAMLEHRDRFVASA